MVDRDKLIKYSLFLIPFTVRLIPELINTHPIGYDTGHYIWAMEYYPEHAGFPLFDDRYMFLAYFILNIVHLSGLSSEIIMKLAPAVFFGLLGYALGRYGEHREDRRFGLLVCLLFTLNLASLRLSWDLQKQVLANAFMVLSAPYIDRDTHRDYGMFTLLAALSVLSHQTTAPSLGLLIAYYAYRKRNWGLILSLLLVGGISLPILLGYVSPSALPEFSEATVSQVVSFTLKAMPLLASLGLIGILADISDPMVIVLIPYTLGAFIVAGGGFIFSGWRLAANLCVPLSYLAAKGTVKVKAMLERYPVLPLVVLLSLLHIAPMVLGSSQSRIAMFMPMNFSDNIFPYGSQHEMDALIEASKWCTVNLPVNAQIYTEDSMVDLLEVYSGWDATSWWNISYGVAMEAAESTDKPVYAVWWYINEPEIKIIAEDFTPGSDLKIMRILK
jgi:hypothetical protein